MNLLDQVTQYLLNAGISIPAIQHYALNTGISFSVITPLVHLLFRKHRTHPTRTIFHAMPYALLGALAGSLLSNSTLFGQAAQFIKSFIR